MTKLDMGVFSVKFPSETTREKAEAILMGSFPQVKFYQFLEKEVGSQKFSMAIIEVCMDHLDKLRADERIIYFEQITDYNPLKSCGNHGCGNC
jgi:hypothetical protein